uniref:Secreted protein n=1 Tax=Heligmosomoides polygyrus TaxID=6339 RepID=A0A183FJM5_HELPZ
LCILGTNRTMQQQSPVHEGELQAVLWNVLPAEPLQSAVRVWLLSTTSSKREARLRVRCESVPTAVTTTVSASVTRSRLSTASLACTGATAEKSFPSTAAASSEESAKRTLATIRSICSGAHIRSLSK